jgi:hypothetical protein
VRFHLLNSISHLAFAISLLFYYFFLLFNHHADYRLRYSPARGNVKLLFYSRRKPGENGPSSHFLRPTQSSPTGSQSRFQETEPPHGLPRRLRSLQ